MRPSSHSIEASVANVVERDDDVFEFNIAMPEGTEVPEAPGISEVSVPTKDPQSHLRVPTKRPSCGRDRYDRGSG